MNKTPDYLNLPIKEKAGSCEPPLDHMIEIF